MRFVTSILTFAPGKPMHTARRKIFPDSCSALRYARKAARKSLRRFPPAAQNIQAENWGYLVGSFPHYYVRTLVQLSA